MRNITFKTEKTMTTTPIKSTESYTISFYICEMLHFEKEKFVNHVRMKVLNAATTHTASPTHYFLHTS